MDNATIIISDLHLGSDCCQSKNLNTFLNYVESNSTRLILNGDTFDSMDFRKLENNHWDILSKLRDMANKIEVVWVAGNHDGPTEKLSRLLGLDTVDEYEFVSGGRKCLVLHGHIFDSFIENHPILTWIGDAIYSLLQKIDTIFSKEEHYIARMVKHSSKNYLHCADTIKQKAIQLAKMRNCDVVCCGHTHHAEVSIVDGIEYVNSGCWTEKPSSFVKINSGIIDLHYFKQGSFYRLVGV